MTNDPLSGLLLHVSSLPSPEGIGTLGPEAHAFVRAVAAAGQRLWQILPVHPTIVGDSPFQGPSAFAGNPNLVSLRALVAVGDLPAADYQAYLNRWNAHCADHGLSPASVDYGFLWSHKVGFETNPAGSSPAVDPARTPLRQAFAGFQTRAGETRRAAFAAFRAGNASWLEDYVRFMALKDQHRFEVLWGDWPAAARDRTPGYDAALDPATLDFFAWVQFVFDEQMRSLRASAARAGVQLLGDLAIYPAYDSADVWAHRDLFQLDAAGRLTFVAAVPPDYFSKLGQLWGNPLYAWHDDTVRERLHGWWEARIRQELRWFDLIKIDHFRGFAGYGRVPADAETAVDAVWVPGPGRTLFDHLAARLGSLPLIAEDLGIITPDVQELLEGVGCPGMKVFQFADWASVDPEAPLAAEDDYLPHCAVQKPHSVFYTGTHDNETLRQRVDAFEPDVRRAFDAYVRLSSEPEMNWASLDLLLACASERVIFPVQDLFDLGPEGRMNNPSLDRGCWQWRLTPAQMEALEGSVGARLRMLTEKHGRA